MCRAAGIVLKAMGLGSTCMVGGLGAPEPRLL
jgi:hypothetical protein